MKKLFLPLFTLLLTLGCSKKSDEPIPEIEEGFVNGTIEHSHYELTNNRVSGIYIRTIRDSPNYTFRFQVTFDNWLGYEGYLKKEDLRVSLRNPVEGKRYDLSSRSDDKENLLSSISCIITTKSGLDAPLIVNRYIPHPAKCSIAITVDKVEKNPINDSDIVEGRIDGFLFSETDRQDSLAVNADFRTILYDDI